MDFIRYDPAKAVPLEGGAGAFAVPVRRGDRLTAMLLVLDKKGDTGKREVPADVMLVVIAGEGRVRSGGEIAELRPGDVAILPGGMQHHIWTQDTQLEAVLITLPAAGAGG
jgi:quercetin dioxygenase-like cupin family protein